VGPGTSADKPEGNDGGEGDNGGDDEAEGISPGKAAAGPAGVRRQGLCRASVSRPGGTGGPPLGGSSMAAASVSPKSATAGSPGVRASPRLGEPDTFQDIKAVPGYTPAEDSASRRLTPLARVPFPFDRARHERASQAVPNEAHLARAREALSRIHAQAVDSGAILQTTRRMAMGADERSQGAPSPPPAIREPLERAQGGLVPFGPKPWDQARRGCARGTGQPNTLPGSVQRGAP